MNYLQRKKLAFMSIVNQIKGFVRTVFGTPPLVLLDCVGGNNLINYSISGNSVQDGTPTPDAPVEIESVGEKTKNLFDVNVITSSSSMIQNGDGTITVSAYPSGTAQTLSQLCPDLKVGDKIIASMESEGSSANIYFYNTKGTIIANKFDSVYTVTQEDLDSRIGFYCLRDENKVNQPARISKIQFLYSDRGENLFDVDSFVRLTGNSDYYAISNDGELIQLQPDYRKDSDLPTAMILPAGTYYARNFGSNYRFYDKTSNSVIYSTTMFTLDTTSEIAVKWWNPADTVIGNPLLLSLTYEPYGYKIPIKVRGKNLLKIAGREPGTLKGTDATTVRNLEFDKYYVGLTRNNIYAPSYVLSCSITGDVVTVEAKIAYTGVTFPIKAKPNTTYRISALNDSVIGIGFYTKDGEFIKDGLTYKTFTTPENCEIMTIVCAPTVTNTATIYEELQVEEGTTATDYEPYQEPTETAIYLDEPLRKVGDVSDYIDFENGRVIRNVKTEKLNTIVNAISSGSQYATGLCRVQYGIPSGNPYNYNATVAPLCTHLQGNKGSIVAKANNITYFEQSAYAYIYLDAINQIGLEPVTSTVSNATIGTAIKNYLNQFDIDIYSVMTTPIEEPINLPQIPLFKGTTVLSLGSTIQPSSMSATYYSTKKGE